MKSFQSCTFLRKIIAGSNQRHPILVAARLLELRIRIPPGYGCLSHVNVVSCTCRGLCDGADPSSRGVLPSVWVTEYEVCSNSIRIGIVVVVHWVGCVCNQS